MVITELIIIRAITVIAILINTFMLLTSNKIILF